jgi:hypothetical protein
MYSIAFAVDNGRQTLAVLGLRVHVAAQKMEKETFQVSKESIAACS